MMSMILLALAIFGFFGSLQYVFPNVLWNDISVFFRKNKTDYLNFSNRFRGKYCFFLGCVSLILFLVSFLFKLPNDGNVEKTLFVILILYFGINEFRLEIKWNKQSHAPRLIMNYFLPCNALISLILIPVIIIKPFPLIELLFILIFIGNCGIFFYLKYKKISF